MEEFDDIYKQYKDRVYNYVFWRVMDRDTAMDITQNIFIKIYKGLKTFRGESSISTWIFSITRNTTINESKKIKRHLSAEELGDVLSIDNRKDVELRTKVFKAMEKLKPEHREIIKMFYFDRFSYREISGILKIEIGTVKSRINRAKNELKKYLGGEFVGIQTG